jgi:glycosyltransferase involved in cell wall biosynthesis
VLSTRSIDKRLYNVDTIVRAMARVRERVPTARLVVVGEGRLRPQLEALAHDIGLGEAVRFTGYLSQEELRREMEQAQVFVSVPTSDATSVALLQAMAVGCFPIVSDLASQQELVEEASQGFRVALSDEGALAEAITQALEDQELRRGAFDRNRAFVEEHGVLETNMAKMEAWYYRLAGRTEEWAPPRFD